MTKTILITGATDGIGRLTAKMLADQGHTLLLHGRNAKKLAAATDAVGGKTLTFEADLSSLEETAHFAEEVRGKVDRLDVLINNAGVYKTDNPVLPNGQDVRFVVNTIAPYLLTTELLPILPKEGRVINLSSAAQTNVSVEAMRGDVRVDDMSAYAQSKRAITLWSAALATRHVDGPVFIAVNPGSLLASKMVKEGFGIAGNDLSIGADVLISAALSDAFAQASGKYFDNDAGQFGAPHPAAEDPDQISAVMAALEEIATPHLR